jgi:hypothetical protein
MAICDQAQQSPHKSRELARQGSYTGTPGSPKVAISNKRHLLLVYLNLQASLELPETVCPTGIELDSPRQEKMV